jgi:Fur family ferric uptake transcriptional regulator
MQHDKDEQQARIIASGWWQLAAPARDSARDLPGTNLGWLRYTVATEWHLVMPFPQTETPGRLQAELMARGLRMTRPRRIILSVVETANQHLDAAQILRRARKLDPDIDRVTVYRTIKLLKRHGLVDELDLMHLQGEKHYYERRPPRDHLHMACLRCGKIMEFESDLFDRLKGQIERDCRFHIVVSRVEMGGYCASCRAAA